MYDHAWIAVIIVAFVPLSDKPKAFHAALTKPQQAEETTREMDTVVTGTISKVDAELERNSEKYKIK